MNTFLSIPAVSKEILYVPGIQAFDESSPDYADPTVLPVQFAFVPPGTDPQPGAWQNGTWTSGRTDQAQILIDPTSMNLSGQVAVWLRVTGAVEQPERQVAILNIN